MEEFTYAHFDTSLSERRTPTEAFNKPVLSPELEEIRRGACSREIPVSDGETLNFLRTLTLAIKPRSVLEAGTAVGLSGAVILTAAECASLTTIERDKNFAREARINFEKLGLSDRVTLIEDEAENALSGLSGQFDLIFLDCAKAQYVKLLPRLKELLKRGGTLAADDVLLFGYVTGERPVPPKRRMLVEHVKEYLSAVTQDSELSTTILPIGNGVSLSVKL